MQRWSLVMALFTRRSVAVGALVAALCGCSAGGRDSADVGGSSVDAPPTESTLASATAAPTTLATTTTTVPICVETVEPGDSLSVIASRTGLALEELEAENAVDSSVTIHPGQEFDICVGNDVDDVTGASRLAPPADAVIRQQTELNDLFAQYSLIPLDVDGDSGKYTRQALCAARMGLGLPVHTGHLAAGSEEEATIFAATELSIPPGAPIENDKWILIDKTCQVIFTGEGNDRLVDIFPTSTGIEGYETYDTRAFAFRFDPALESGGWHDSASFPVAVDNPANGNMYKPLYFNNGQAIHGASYIPPEPRSKGCARTFPLHQDMILEWLGLDDVTQPIWNADAIDVSVMVRGLYQDRTA
jgi:hypothetical protein